MRKCLFPLFLSTFIAYTSFSSPAYSHEGHDHSELSSTTSMPTPEAALEAASEEASETVTFTPPKDWRIADAQSLPKSVKVMVIGKGENQYPPSINLGAEKFDGTLKDYLKIVKSLNEARGASWKDLGKIQTEAGTGSLSQVDLKTEWGDVRMMHVILVKSGNAYIMTAASLKDEFPTFYKDFFASMKSLRINKPNSTK